MKEFNLAAASQIASNSSWDVVLFLVFVAVGFLYGLSSGRARLIAVLFSLYISYLLLGNARFIDRLLEGRELLEIFFFQLTFFLVLVILLSIFFSKTLSFVRKNVASQKWWHVFLLSFLETGLFASIAFRLLPDAQLFTFSPLVQYLFASPNAFFVWLFLPLPVLFFIMRKS